MQQFRSPNLKMTILERDDNPLAIRNDHGTIQVASLLGGDWGRHENDPPLGQAVGLRGCG